MICSLLIDQNDSPDFPESSQTVLGRPLAAYPLIAATSCARIRHHYAVTRTPPVKSVAAQNNAILIDWPAEAEKAKGLELFNILLLAGGRFIDKDLQEGKEKWELLCVLLANAPSVSPDMILSGIEALLERPDLDSALGVSPGPRLPPFSARRENAEGLLEPLAAGPAVDGMWYPHWGLQILRPRGLDLAGPPPLSWLGRKVFPLKEEAPGPVDYQWQIPAVEAWLTERGTTDAAPRRQPKSQPLPRAKPR